MESQAPQSVENQLGAEQSQIVRTSPQNLNGVSTAAPAFNLNEGNFQRPHFGPLTKTKHVRANKIERAKIIHHHHNYSTQQQSPGDSPSTSNVSGDDGTDNQQRLSTNIPEGYAKISEDIYMYTEKPMKKGTNVYRGFQVHITGQKQWLAIKKITPCKEKSIREVQHLVNLSPHPNVVRILRSKVHKGLTHKELYIAMELCKDENLQDYLSENREKKKPLNLQQAISFAKQLVKAIQHIHRNGIIHGDLKPENILFSLDGEQIKVSDFGISKQLRDSKSKTTITGRGTDGYRAPETYSSEHISKSADVYSLGIILFALFANGDHPYGSDPHLCIYNIKNNLGLNFETLPLEMGSLREVLISLLRKIFQLDPKTRPTIGEILMCPLFSDIQTQIKQVSYRGDDIVQQRGNQDSSTVPSSDVTPQEAPDVGSSTASSNCTTPKRVDFDLPTTFYHRPTAGGDSLHPPTPTSLQRVVINPSTSSTTYAGVPSTVLPYQLPIPISYQSKPISSTATSQDTPPRRVIIDLTVPSFHKTPSPDKPHKSPLSYHHITPQEVAINHSTASHDHRIQQAIDDADGPLHTTSPRTAISQTTPQRTTISQRTDQRTVINQTTASFDDVSPQAASPQPAYSYCATLQEADIDPVPSHHTTPQRVDVEQAISFSRLTSDVDPKAIRAAKRKLNGLSFDLDKLVWHVIRFNRTVDIIPNIKSGCRICHHREQRTSNNSDLCQLKIKINGCEKSIHDLHDVRMQELWSTLWPGIVVWFDCKTLTLFAFNLCENSTKLKFHNECDHRFKKLLPSKQSISIYSVEKLMDFVGTKWGPNGCRNELPGVEFDDGCLGRFKLIPSFG